MIKIGFIGALFIRGLHVDRLSSYNFRLKGLYLCNIRAYGYYTSYFYITMQQTYRNDQELYYNTLLKKHHKLLNVCQADIASSSGPLRNPTWKPLEKEWDSLRRIWNFRWRKEGSGFDVESNALIKKPRIKKEAKVFLDWAISEEAMAMYAKVYPIVATDIKVDAPEGWPSDPMSVLIENDLEWAANNRKRILKEWTKRYDGKSAPKK